METIFLIHWKTILLMAFLLVLSAFFSGSETAFFSLRAYEIRDFSRHKNPIYRMTAKLLASPHKLLITILFCNLIINLFFFSLSISLEKDVLRIYGKGGAFIMGVSSVVLIILLGEVTPKAVALTIPRQIAYLSTLPLGIIQSCFYPLIVFLERLSQFILNIFKKESSSSPTIQELKQMLQSSGESHFLSAFESKVIQEILDIDSIQVREVMVPRVKVISLNLDEYVPKTLIEMIGVNRHTYYPVYEDTIDNIVTVLDGKEFLFAPSQKREEILLYSELPLFVSEYSSLSYVLDVLRGKKSSIAIVVDEYGGFSGIITLEDIVEEIFGEFQDESDSKLPPPIQKITHNKYTISGFVTLRELGELLEVSLEAVKVSTISGFISSLQDGFPKVGDQFFHEQIRFTVVKADKHSVTSVFVEKLPTVIEIEEEKL